MGTVTSAVMVCDRFLGWVERFDNDLHSVILDFEAVSLDDDPPLTAGDDAAECAWAPLAAVPEMLLVPGLAEFLSDHGFIELLA